MHTTQPDVLALALHMVRLGYRVEPCRLRWNSARAKKRDPEGLPSDWQLGGLVDFPQIRAAFERRRANAYLIVCGTTRLVGVDLDVKPALGVDGTAAWARVGGPSSPLTVRTPSGGTHLYYADPVGEFGNLEAVLTGIDLRGVGGGLYGPGSSVVDEHGTVIGTYQLVGTEPPAVTTLPGAPDVLRRIIAARGSSATAQDGPDAAFWRPDTPLSLQSAGTVLTDQCREITGHIRLSGWSGFRSVMIRASYTLGGLVGAGFLTPDVARDRLVAAIREADAEPDDDDLLWIEQGLSDGSDKPFRRADSPPTAAPLPVNGHAPALNGHGGSGAGIADLREQGVSRPLSSDMSNSHSSPVRVADRNGATTPEMVSNANDISSQDRAPRRLPMIPDAVWEARPWLIQIRDDARAREICPDAVLGSVLAIVAANVHHSVRVDTGTKTPLTTSLLVGLVGPSGSDKTTSFAHALRMTPPGSVPALPTPSGEGIAERFMGVHETVDASGKLVRERVQTSHNALYYVDEGEVLTRTMDRSGATLGGQLRALWSGQTLGNTNASEDRRRCVPAGSYSIGFVVGYQVGTVVRLLRDLSTGMAQRFLWFSALDSVAHAPVTDTLARIGPGTLAMPRVTALSEVAEHDGTTVRVMTTTREVTDGIVARQRARRATLDIGEDDPDSQRDVMVAKLAALVVLLENRSMIETADWALATAIYAASAAVRDDLAALADEADAIERRHAAARAGESDHVRRRFADDVARVAGVLVRRLYAAGVPLSKPKLRSAAASRDRAHVDTAIALAIHTGWLRDLGDCYVPGPVAFQNVNETHTAERQT